MALNQDLIKSINQTISKTCFKKRDGDKHFVSGSAIFAVVLICSILIVRSRFLSFTTRYLRSIAVFAWLWLMAGADLL